MIITLINKLYIHSYPYIHSYIINTMDYNTNYLLQIPTETLQTVLESLGYVEVCRLSATCTALSLQCLSRWPSLLLEDYGMNREQLLLKYTPGVLHATVAPPPTTTTTSTTTSTTTTTTIPSSTSDDMSSDIQPTTRALYIYLHRRLAPAAFDYLPMLRIWTRLEQWCKQNEQEALLMSSFNPPCSDTIFNDQSQSVVEVVRQSEPRRKPQVMNRYVGTPLEPPTKEVLSFPPDYVASCLIYDGQQLNTQYGLFGTLEAYDFQSNIILLSYEIAKKIYMQRIFYNTGKIYTKLWPVACSMSTERYYYLVINDDLNYNDLKFGNVMLDGGSNATNIAVANTFREFMDSHVKKLEQRVYTLRDDVISRYPEYSPYITEVKTHGVWVKGSALYVPEDRHRYNTFYYRITIWMDEDEDQTNSCQLVARHWDITTSLGTNTVDGEGVIGMYPKITPGSKFEYCSKCELETTTGTMSGYFKMSPMFPKPFSPDMIQVIVPPFTLTIQQH
ncbi:hypothetical protein SAMD00019534_066120, partial [Acytostelium subglobosum LB1]|uniref:hypothetical protein n=1 Tax=Acytostelium subglobosum LB1 TaxID=1410327 RepID=UPI000644B969